MQQGDWPFCESPGGHGSTRRGNALPFDPVLIYERPAGSYDSPDRRYYWPGANTEGPPPDCPTARPIRLDTLQAADKFMRSVNAQEQEGMDIRTEMKRNHYDKAVRESREKLRAELERRGLPGQHVEAIIADRDSRGPGREEVMRQFEAVARATGQEFNKEHAERIYEETQKSRRDPNYRSRPQSDFAIEVFAKDSSNRHGYRDERTGWRMRKS